MLDEPLRARWKHDGFCFGLFSAPRTARVSDVRIQGVPEHGLLRVVTVAHDPKLAALATDARDKVETRRNALQVMAAFRTPSQRAAPRRHIPTASSASSAATFASVEYLGS